MIFNVTSFKCEVNNIQRFRNLAIGRFQNALTYIDKDNGAHGSKAGFPISGFYNGKHMSV